MPGPEVGEDLFSGPSLAALDFFGNTFLKVRTESDIHRVENPDTPILRRFDRFVAQATGLLHMNAATECDQSRRPANAV
jgi:hypothetical protein